MMKNETHGYIAAHLAGEVVRKDGGMENTKAKKEGLPIFVRDDLPSYTGIATFLKSPYIEDPLNLEGLDVAFVGAPFTTVYNVQHKINH